MRFTIAWLIAAAGCGSVSRDQFDGTVDRLWESQRRLAAHIAAAQQAAGDPAPKPAEIEAATAARKQLAVLIDGQKQLAERISALTERLQRLEDRARPGEPTPRSRKEPQEGSIYAVPIDDSPIRGERDAWVTVVVFSAYDCKPCRDVNGTLKRLLRRHRGDLRVVYKHNMGFDPPDRPALAAQCAHQQGRFWEMHDRLSRGGKVPMESHARRAGLDTARFEACMQAPDSPFKITRDSALAAELGVQGTPWFFINGKPLKGARPLAEFDAIISAAKAVAQASGMSRASFYERAILRRGATAAR